MEKSECRFALVIVALLALCAGGLFEEGIDNMASGYPDWTEPVLLMGEDPDGNLILVQVNADGKLTVPIQGKDPDGDMVDVAVDALGQIIIKMKGANNNIVAVDSDGYLSAILKGQKADTSLANIAIDDDGQLYTIIKGSGGNIVAVDSDGFLTTVLKGEYGGSLYTIGLDSEGRISGYLVDDLDQWGKILRVGNAEQAARLGSMVSWDRRGQAQRLITFEHGIPGLQKVEVGSGTSIQLDPVYWISGGYSAKFVTGAAATSYASLGGRLGTPPSSKVGLSVSWASTDSPDWLYLELIRYGGTTKLTGRLQFDDGAETLNYYDSDGNYAKIADLELSASDYSWHNMKLVVDFDAGTYTRALVNDTEYEMSAAMRSLTVPATSNYVLFTFYVDGYAALTSTLYLDNMILTTNEPAN